MPVAVGGKRIFDVFESGTGVLNLKEIFRHARREKIYICRIAFD